MIPFFIWKKIRLRKFRKDNPLIFESAEETMARWNKKFEGKYTKRSKND